ncbi:MAG: hypothetical protein NUV67_03895 [archaeon]|nr:hypothetical protein [archaeon]
MPQRKLRQNLPRGTILGRVQESLLEHATAGAPLTRDELMRKIKVSTNREFDTLVKTLESKGLHVPIAPAHTKLGSAEAIVRRFAHYNPAMTPKEIYLELINSKQIPGDVMQIDVRNWVMKLRGTHPGGKIKR